MSQFVSGERQRGELTAVQDNALGDHALHAEQIYERIASVRSMLVEHPAFVEGIAAIRRCHRMGRYGLEEPGCLLIVGVSGSGKSTLRKEYAKHHPNRETAEGTLIPVLHFELPAQPTIKNVAERILIEMGDPLFTRGSAETMTSRIVALLRACEVQLVILDEFQHFIDNSSEKVDAKVADWLKHLINVSKVPFVLMGLHRCRRILQSNEQLRRRFSRQISLEPFAVRDQRTKRLFVGLVHSLFNSLPVAPSKELLSEPDFIDRVHFATYGLMGYVMALLSAAVQIALERRQESIDQDVLLTAFSEAIWPDSIPSSNPFHAKFAFRSLTALGEPFHGY